MSVGSDNMQATTPVLRTRFAIIRHLPYFIAAAILVALAAGMSFDGYVLNILLQATTFSVAVGRTYDGSANYPAATTTVKTFLCPADPAGERVPGLPYGATSYAANAGSGAPWATTPVTPVTSLLVERAAVTRLSVVGGMKVVPPAAPVKLLSTA